MSANAAKRADFRYFVTDFFERAMEEAVDSFVSVEDGNTVASATPLAFHFGTTLVFVEETLAKARTLS